LLPIFHRFALRLTQICLMGSPSLRDCTLAFLSNSYGRFRLQNLQNTHCLACQRERILSLFIIIRARICHVILSANRHALFPIIFSRIPRVILLESPPMGLALFHVFRFFRMQGHRPCVVCVHCISLCRSSCSSQCKNESSFTLYRDGSG
jgi:hypothetical protein